jgi:hypothetical protein
MRALLASDSAKTMALALNGRDDIFSKQNRDLLIALSFCEDEKKKIAIARKIAEDTAERWHSIPDDDPEAGG